MADPYLLRSDLLASAVMEEAMKAVEIRRNIERMIPRTLTEDLASAAQAQLERQLSMTNALMSSSIVTAQQKLMAQLDMDRVKGFGLATAALEEQMRRVSLVPHLGGFEEAARAMQRSVDLESTALRSTILADLQRVSALASQSYAQFAQSFSIEVMSDSISRSMLGSWHDAFGAKFISQVQEAFEEEVAEDPKADFFTLAFAAILKLLTASGFKADSHFVASLAMSLLISLAFATYEEGIRLDAEEQVAEIEWHIDRHLERQDKMIEAFATKEVVRGTRIWARPDSGSRVLGHLKAGALVIPRQRKGKWTMVALRADDSPTGVAVTGWMLNKYLN